MFYKATSFQKQQLQTICGIFLVGGCAIAALLWQSYPDLISDKTTVCQIKQQNATITRSQALQLLATKEGGKRPGVVAWMREPYCQLPPLSVRAGAASQRDVYPLDSDPDIWVVLLYEDGQYAGYRFLARQKYKVK